MAQTPLSTATPYCSALKLFTYHDAQQCADMLRDGDGPRPSRLCILDPTSDPGAVLLEILLGASGELESACLIGDRYSPTDLGALTGSGLQRLTKLVADLAFWTLAQRRQPSSADPEKVPGAKQALAELDRLRNGERIFGLQESADAGLPDVSEPEPTRNIGSPVVSQSSRFFGTSSGDPRRRF